MKSTSLIAAALLTALTLPVFAQSGTPVAKPVAGSATASTTTSATASAATPTTTASATKKAVGASKVKTVKHSASNHAGAKKLDNKATAKAPSSPVSASTTAVIK